MRRAILPLLCGLGCAPADDVAPPADEPAADELADTARALEVDCAADVPVGELGEPACGEPLFVEHCTSCHGAYGRGTELGPNLAGHVPFHSDAELLWLLVTGIGDVMPPAPVEGPGAAHLLGFLRDRFGAYQGPHP